MQRAIRGFDFFSYDQFTLYRSQESYSTLTGGVASLMLLGVLIAIFVKMAIQTFSYANIFAAIQTSYDSDPARFSRKINPQNKLAIAVGITAGQQFSYQSLNVEMYHIVTNSTGGFLDTYNSQYVRLDPCDFSQWEGISDQISKEFKRLEIGLMLCPPKDFQFQLQGNVASQISKYFRIEVSTCVYSDCVAGNRSYAGLNGTAPSINIFYVNTIINPTNKNPFTYYIQKSLNFYLYFDKIAPFIDIQFSQYQMQTDWSLLPWENKSVQKGIMTKGASSISYQALPLYEGYERFAYINLIKSNERITIKRTIQKVTDVISFVGGLLGPLLLVFSFLKFYNRFVYEIEFGYMNFKQKHGSKLFPQSINFLTYTKYLVHGLIKNLGFQSKWESLEGYEDCRAEVVKQSDVYLLFKKVEVLEEACSVLLEKQHRPGLHLLAKKTLLQAKAQRHRFLMEDLFARKVQRRSREQGCDEQEYKRDLEKAEGFDLQFTFEDERPPNEEIVSIEKELQGDYERLLRNSQNGDNYSVKIMKNLEEEQSLVSLLANYLQRQKRKRQYAQFNLCVTESGLQRPSNENNE